MATHTNGRRVLNVLMAAAGTAVASNATAPAVPDRMPLQAALLGLLNHPDGARNIGARYLSLVPAEGDQRHLVNLLAKGAPGLMAREEARALLQNAVREDFDQGRTVELNGWVISRTEARLCALASLA